MKSFPDIQREAYHTLEKYDTTLKLVDDGAESGPSGVFVTITADLRLNEPVQVAICRIDETSLTCSSSSPLAQQILTLAENVAADSVVQQQATASQCLSLVSFPERLANKTASNTTAPFTFNSELYWERLSDAVLLLFLTKLQPATNTDGKSVSPEQLYTILENVVGSMVRRGIMATMLRRLAMLSRDIFQGECLLERLSPLFRSVFEACRQRRFALTGTREVKMTQAWSDWNLHFFALLEKRPEVKNEIVIAAAAIMNDFSTEESTLLANHLFSSLFATTCFLCGSSRRVVRVIFQQLLPLVAGKREEGETVTARETKCFNAVLGQWDNKQFVTVSNLSANLALLHPVMYSVLYLHDKNPSQDRLPAPYTGMLMNGVTFRLESTRGEALRTSALTVAAAFATLFLKDKEEEVSMLQDENYAGALEDWMKEENKYAPLTSTGSKASATTRSGQNLNSTTERRAVAAADRYPLDPDEFYTFFVTSHERRRDKIVPFAPQNPAIHQTPDPISPSTLPSFGQQKYEKDELDEHVSILSSIRESYNAITGVGRKANAQQHEVQEAIESGLRGLADAFAKVRDKIGSDLFASVGKETGSLIPELLPALISLSIHAPEAHKKLLLELRYNSLVFLLVLNPLLSLRKFGSMIYHGNYGVYQRSELIRAIGEAATFLSSVEVKDDANKIETDSSEHSSPREQKRIYPPIPTHQVSGPQKTAIVVTEGQRTRRWGNAVTERNRQRRVLKRYTNMLGDVAPAFVAAFLFKMDADHFAFFQDTDPYTPCAILDSLTAVFHGITNVRHVAPDLCEKNFDFFFAVATIHPNVTVRKTAWITIVELMRTWCGVEPMWIQHADGERVLNRESNLHRSLAFTKNWLDALDLLQSTCSTLLKDNDACGHTALVVVSNLRDLVCDRDDFQTMLARSNDLTVVR